MPRFINPVLAESNIDLDLSTLLFSGLMRRHPDGSLENDLAKEHWISENQKTYIFTLKDNLQFEDGNDLTAQDVVYTIQQTQVSQNQSPHRESWQGIKVTALDAKTVQFDLPQPFAGFLSLATIGIVPSHIWQTIPSEQFTFASLNTEPVASGRFKVTRIRRNKTGTPIAYEMKPNLAHWEQDMYLRKLTLRLYPDEGSLVRAFSRGDIDSMAAISPQAIETLPQKNLTSAPLPRIFALYINRARSEVLQDQELLEIIEQAIDKDSLINEVLHGHGSPVAGPLPNRLSTVPASDNGISGGTLSFNSALDLLGWLRPPGEPDGLRQKGGSILQFDIATSDTPELVATADLIKRNLSELGILVTISVFEIQNLEVDIIQPRNFETLLFGQVVRHDTDLYAFWHSSQATSEGLNIANYENKLVDDALSSSLSTSDVGLRRNLYRTVEEQIINDKPAIFLYTPHLVYVTRKDIGNFDTQVIHAPADRLLAAHTWYVVTERIWNFLTNY